MKTLLVVVMLAMLACCALSAQAEQMVINPGFESGSIDGSWGVVTQPVAIDSTVAHSGTYSVKMSALSSFMYCDFPKGTLKPGTEYEFSMWIKSENADATLVVSGLLNDPVTEVPKYVGLSTYDWTNVTYTFTTKDTVTGGPIYFTMYGNSMGQIWIDDTTLTTTGPAPIADVVADWSSTNNPNGQWSYGFLPSSTDPVLAQGTLYPYTWDFAGSYWSTAGQTVWRGLANINGSNIFLAGGYWADRPEWEVYQSLGTIAWTAPAGGDYRIVSTFTAHESSSKVYVIKKNVDGVLSYLNPMGSDGQVINGAASEVYSYIDNINMYAGESIFFAEYNNKPGLLPNGGILDNYVTFNAWIYEAAAPSSSLTGIVDLADFVGDKTIIPVTIELTGVDPYVTNLDADGKFSVNIADGTYDVRIKASHWLSRFISGVAISGVTDMGSVTLINGDCDGDNEVTSTDLSILGLALGSMDGDVNWDATADLDGDGEVTSTDLSILGISLGITGE